MRVPLILIASLVAVTGAGALAATVLGSGGEAEPATSLDTTYRAKTSRGELVGTSAHQVSARGTRPTIRHFATRKSFTVSGGDNLLLRIPCPRGFDPVTGGTLSPPGLAISNSSQSNPEPDARTKPRSWYIGVTNVTLQQLRFKGTIVCSKGIG